MYINSTGGFEGDSAFFWNSTLDRLGLGTNTPNNRLHINETATTTAVYS